MSNYPIRVFVEPCLVSNCLLGLGTSTRADQKENTTSKFYEIGEDNSATKSIYELGKEVFLYWLKKQEFHPDKENRGKFDDLEIIAEIDGKHINSLDRGCKIFFSITFSNENQHTNVLMRIAKYFSSGHLRLFQLCTTKRPVSVSICQSFLIKNNLIDDSTCLRREVMKQLSKLALQPHVQPLVDDALSFDCTLQCGGRSFDLTVRVNKGGHCAEQYTKEILLPIQKPKANDRYSLHIFQDAMVK